MAKKACSLINVLLSSFGFFALSSANVVKIPIPMNGETMKFDGRDIFISSEKGKMQENVVSLSTPMQILSDKPQTVVFCGNEFFARNIRINAVGEADRMCANENGDIIDACTGDKMGSIEFLDNDSMFVPKSKFIPSEQIHKIKFSKGKIENAATCDFEVVLNSKLSLKVPQNVNTEDLVFRQNGEIVNIRNLQVIRRLNPNEFYIQPKGHGIQPRLHA